ncbi:MAG: hypothetical protein U0167_09140 [bacterium]
MFPLPRPLGIALACGLLELAARPAFAAPAETWNELSLRRAAALLTEGDVAGARDVLAARDSTTADPRADFLEAWAAHSLGDRARFAELTARLHASGGDFARWADILAGLDAARVAPGLATPGSAPAESLAALFQVNVGEAAKTARPVGAAAERARHEAAAQGLTALREKRYDDARKLLDGAEVEWRAEDDALAHLESPSDSLVDRIFRTWNDGAPGEKALRLDVGATESTLRARMDATLDLHLPTTGDVARPILLPAEPMDAPPAASFAPLPAPSAEERRPADDLAAQLDAARTTLGRDRRALVLAEDDAHRGGRYYGHGADLAAGEIRSLDEEFAKLRALMARSAEIVAQLAALEDAETHRIAARTAQFLEECRGQLLVAMALVRFRTEGPAARHHEALPPDVPSPAEILSEEQVLSGALESWLQTFAERAPVLVARSHDEIWKPRATTGLRKLTDDAERERARANRIAAAIDSTKGAETDPARRAPLVAAVRTDEILARKLADALRMERKRVVVAAVASARDAHRRAGEGLFYGAAAAAHELALASKDSTDDATSRARSRALLADAEVRYRAFLDAYPQSTARSEVRFRLADALLVDAREDFRDAMTRFLGNSGAATETDARSLAPFVDYGPALEIYLSLLADDPKFAHRDAVLYHAGMILTDENDPKGLVHLATLVSDYPDSPHAQEAHLRLGDDRIGQKDVAGALAHYEAASHGPDVEHSAIALYHVGWARFQLDDFDGSALAFHQLTELYRAHPDAARTTDLRDEAEDHLVQALARGGGAVAFARLFPVAPAGTHDSTDAEASRTLARLGDLYRGYSRFDDAVRADSLWLARWPEAPEALDAARRLASTMERGEKPDAARDARLALAPQFREGSPWWKANAADSLRQAGDEFARNAYVGAALHHHELARTKNAPADWSAAADLYATLLEGWPKHGSAPAWHYGAGEAAISLGRYENAVKSFDEAAASDTASFRVDAAWHAVHARDSWYESERPAGTAADRGPGPEKLAKPLLAAIDAFVGYHPDDKRVGDLLWRKGHVAQAHGWSDEAVGAFAQLAAVRPADPRALDSSRLAAQLLVDRGDFKKAGDAYASAARLARTTGKDSIAVKLEAAVPACAFKDAESVATKKGDGEDSARLFEDVAARWPKFTDAPRALYRAGAGFAAAKETADAVRVWTLLGNRYPKSDLARDASVETARAWKAAGRKLEASRASERFADTFPADPDAPAALLDAADLAYAAGDSTDGGRLEDKYMTQHPQDVETTMAVLDRRARGELASVSAAHPVSGLLAAPTKTRPASATRRWMDLAKAHPKTASRELLAQVAFLGGEEARAAYERVTLTQPLKVSVAKKKSLLENALKEYRSCAAQETAPWNRAAATRIGECLVAFGDALMQSERPADLGKDDLVAYEEVLSRQSAPFFDKGEDVWSQLVRHAGDAPKDEWVERAKQELWPRIARRFSHVPEVDYPLVTASSDGDSQP